MIPPFCLWGCVVVLCCDFLRVCVLKNFGLVFDNFVVCFFENFCGLVFDNFVVCFLKIFVV